MNFHGLAQDVFWLIIVCLVCGFVLWLVDKAPIDGTFKAIAKGCAIFLLIVMVVFFLAGLLGLAGPIGIR